MSVERIRIATRSSPLALWQAQHVYSLLQAHGFAGPIELVKVISAGDSNRAQPLHEIGGVGLFTKEVQEAVLANQADLAVHSLKDLPTVPHPRLVLTAVPSRGPVGDVLVAPEYKTFDRLPLGARVATSSLRRQAQLLRLRPDLHLVDIRGNVETRLRKLREDNLDALLLAEAGLFRLGFAEVITQRLPHEIMLPAVAQGALGIECRASDEALRTLLAPLEDAPTRYAVDAERSFLKRLQGGCQVPIAAHAVVTGRAVRLRGRVLDRRGTAFFEGELTGPTHMPELTDLSDPTGAPLNGAKAVGNVLAERLLFGGADRVLELH